MQITVRNLTKAYGSSRALDGVSLDVGPGEIVALLGANGAGKTTLLRCLATVAAPTSGSIELDGERLTRSRLDLRRRLFFLPDTPFLHYDATPVRHLAMVARVYGKEASLTADRAWRLLEDLDLLGSAAAPAMNLPAARRTRRRSPASWPWIPSWPSWTSRSPRAWTRTGCWSSSAGRARRPAVAPPSSTRRRSWRSPRASPTGWRSSIRVGSIWPRRSRSSASVEPRMRPASLPRLLEELWTTP